MQHQVLFFESLLWLNLGLNPSLPDHWWILCSFGQWSGIHTLSIVWNGISDPSWNFGQSHLLFTLCQSPLERLDSFPVIGKCDREQASDGGNEWELLYSWRKRSRLCLACLNQTCVLPIAKNMSWAWRKCKVQFRCPDDIWLSWPCCSDGFWFRCLDVGKLRQ